MTEGSIIPLVIKFALPLTIGNILQMLYNTVDTLVVGRFLGATSIAAVGTSAQPLEILLCIFLGIGSGVSILVAQAVGRKDSEQLKKIIDASIFFLFAAAIPITIIGYFLGPQLLKLISVPEDAFKLAVQYLQVLFLGTIGQIGYNLNAGILRGLGDSTASLIFLIISCCVNIVLDLFFVAVLHTGVAGAALATSIAMLCSWIFSIIYIKVKYKELAFKILPGKFDSQTLKEIVKTGLPLGLNHSLYSFGHLTMQGLINSQGSNFMASCVIASKLTGLSNIAITSLSSAGLTFAGQNYGAKKYCRIKKGGILIPFGTGLVTMIGAVIVMLFIKPILSIFTDNEQVIQMATMYIRIVLPFTWCYAIFNGIINIANGLGKVRFSTVVNILMLWAVRIPSAYFIKTFIDGKYLMASISISFVFGMLCMLSFYKSKNWKEICRLAKDKTLETN